MTSSRGKSLIISVAVAAVIVAGLGLRTLNIAHESAWLDEVLSLQCLDAPTLSAFLQEDRKVDSPLMMPVYFTLEYGWARLTGGSILAMRILSLIFGVLTLPVMYAFGRRLYGPLAGLVATACLAVSLPHIFFAQEIRMYSLQGLLVLLSFYTLWEASRSSGRLYLCLHILVNGLLLWTHLMSALLFVPQAVYWLMIHRRNVRRLAAWGGAHALIAASGVAWILANGVPREASWMPEASVRELINTFLIFAGGRASNMNPGPYLPANINLDLFLSAGIAAMVVGLAWWSLKRDKPEPARDSLALLLLWLVVPSLLLLAVSSLWRPCFLYRYVIGSSLAVPLIIGAAVVSMKRVRWRVVTCLLLAAMYGHQLLVLNGPFRPDYREAAQYLNARASETDRLLILKSLNTVPFQYQCHVPMKYIDTFEGFEPLCANAVEHASRTTVYVLMWRWDDTALFETKMEQAQCRVERQAVGGMPPVLIYTVTK